MLARKLFIVLLIMALTPRVYAQRYAFDTTGITFRKSIDFGTVHGYLEIENLTNDTLNMGWICRTDSSFPAAWEVNFDDQNQYYPSVRNDSSAVFKLYPSGTFLQKLIIGLAHHQVIDTQEVQFSIFPTDTAGDTTLITYRFEIFREVPDTSAGDTTHMGWHEPKANQAMEVIDVEGGFELRMQLSGSVRIFSINGQLLRSFGVIQRGQHIHVPTHRPVIIQFQNQQAAQSLKWLPKR